MSAQLGRIAEVIRIPNARPGLLLTPYADRHSGLDELSRGDAVARRLEAWKPPALPDEILETLAAIFLMQPGHELIPFFLWLEQRLRLQQYP